MPIQLISRKAGEITNGSSQRQEMKTVTTTVKPKLNLSTWFVVLSPALGVLFGFLSLLIFAR